MEWLTSALTACGLALILYGLYLTWPPLVFTIGGLIALRVAWSLDRSDS